MLSESKEKSIQLIEQMETEAKLLLSRLNTLKEQIIKCETYKEMEEAIIEYDLYEALYIYNMGLNYGDLIKIP